MMRMSPKKTAARIENKLYDYAKSHSVARNHLIQWFLESTIGIYNFVFGL